MIKRKAGGKKSNSVPPLGPSSDLDLETGRQRIVAKAAGGPVGLSVLSGRLVWGENRRNGRIVDDHCRVIRLWHKGYGELPLCVRDPGGGADADARAGDGLTEAVHDRSLDR